MHKRIADFASHKQSIGVEVHHIEFYELRDNNKYLVRGHI
jgi:hypothetical protein